MIFRKPKGQKGSTPSMSASKTDTEKSQSSSISQKFQKDVKESSPSRPSTSSSMSPQPPSSASESIKLSPQQGMVQKDSNTLFLEILIMAMKAKETRGLSLADLEWFLLPPVRFNQAVVAEAKANENGKPLPVGFLLWAKVSPEIDQRLSQDQSTLPRLEPQDWQSGQIPWVIAAAGRPEIVKAMLERVVKLPLQNQAIKLRIANPDGSFNVKELKVRPEAQEQKSANDAPSLEKTS